MDHGIDLPTTIICPDPKQSALINDIENTK